MWPPKPDPSRVAPQVVAGLVAEGEAMSPDEAYEYALARLSGYLPEIDVPACHSASSLNSSGTRPSSENMTVA